MIKKITIMISLLLSLSVGSYAKDIFKRYPVKSGMILYDINVTGVSNSLKTTTLGISRLVFDEWGAVELREDDATETQEGDFNEEISRHTMSSLDHGTIYTVDFDENVTYETRDKNMDLAIAQGADLSNEMLDILVERNATKMGVESVAGYECDIWNIGDQSICLYMGIPLKITIEAPGFVSTRTAQFVMLDKPVNKKEFRLPGFAIMVDGGYTNNASASVNMADYMSAVTELKGALQKMAIKFTANSKFTKEQEMDMINALGAKYLAKQKKYLPQLMGALHTARGCVDGSENGQEAQKCIKPVDEINAKLGDQTTNYEYRNWSPKSKDIILKDMDQEMKDLNLTIDCTSRYSKTTEVIKCTEGTLEPKI